MSVEYDYHGPASSYRTSRVGDEMIDTIRTTTDGRRVAHAIFAVAFFLLIVSAAGAAERVVLGEYFTNIY